VGHVLLIFGTLVAVNLGIGYMVSDYLYEDDAVQGVVEVEEVAPADATTESSAQDASHEAD
jgi:hypothetical protein